MSKKSRIPPPIQQDTFIIKCINCQKAIEPSGYPVVILCTKLKKKLVGESIRKCRYFIQK